MDRGYTIDQTNSRIKAQGKTHEKETYIKNCIERDKYGDLLKINTEFTNATQCALNIMTWVYNLQKL